MAKEKSKKAHIVSLGKIRDKRGNLSVVEEGGSLPFEIARTYWIYDVPGGEHRGGHAYYKSEELIIALSGSFEVEVSDGKEEQTFRLEHCDKALYVPAGVWRQLRNFATNSTALVVASTPYSARDYIRKKELFIDLKNRGEI